MLFPQPKGALLLNGSDGREIGSHVDFEVDVEEKDLASLRFVPHKTEENNRPHPCPSVLRLRRKQNAAAVRERGEARFQPHARLARSEHERNAVVRRRGAGVGSGGDDG